MTSVIRVDHLHKKYGDFVAVDDVSFSVEAGEIFGPFAISDANQLYRFPATGRGQRFTFRVVESSGGNTGVFEVAVFTRGSQ
jgi:hypothetical protein